MSDDKQNLIHANLGGQSPIPASAPGVMYNEPPPPYSLPGEHPSPSQYVKPYPTQPYPEQQPTPYSGQPTPYSGQQPPMQQYYPPAGQQIAHPGQQIAPPGTILIAQSPPIIIAQLPPTTVLGRESTRSICPHCSSDMSTNVDKDPTMAAYISAAILCILGCAFGCCLIPFCIDSCRQSEHYCPNCKRHLGTVGN